MNSAKYCSHVNAQTCGRLTYWLDKKYWKIPFWYAETNPWDRSRGIPLEYERAIAEDVGPIEQPEQVLINPGSIGGVYDREERGMFTNDEEEAQELYETQKALSTPVLFVGGCARLGAAGGTGVAYGKKTPLVRNPNRNIKEKNMVSRGNRPMPKKQPKVPVATPGTVPAPAKKTDDGKKDDQKKTDDGNKK
jgi:hypothetical protein